MNWDLCYSEHFHFCSSNIIFIAQARCLWKDQVQVNIIDEFILILVPDNKYLLYWFVSCFCSFFVSVFIYLFLLLLHL